MSQSGDNKVSLSAKFSFPSGVSSEVEQSFDASNCKPAIIGLAPGVEAVKPKGGEYGYSGMHDHGPLPAPKEGGDFALLIDIVQQAKKNSDELLTRIINEEKAGANKNSDRITKKLKIGE